MAILNEVARATAVIKSNKYFALATVDNRGPWVSTLAYTLGPPSCLYFFSQAASRHGSALTTVGQVAGVIYDSTATGDDIESVQFSGKGEVAHDKDTISYVLNTGALQAGEAPPTQEKIDEMAGDRAQLLYRITIQDAFVLDQQLFADAGIDARQPVDISRVFIALLRE